MSELVLALYGEPEPRRRWQNDAVLQRQLEDCLGKYAGDERCETADGFTIVLVDSEGGSEGEGEAVWRVYAVKHNGEPLAFFETTGCYTSEEGIEFDKQLARVYPQRVITTRYIDTPQPDEVPPQSSVKKLQIPSLGSSVRVAADWTFALHNESRNRSLMDHFKIVYPEGYWPQYEHFNKGGSTQVTLPAGTKLAIDRIYIRRGNDDFDSITFRITELEGKPVKKMRFWVKLPDVNDGQLELIDG